MTALALAVEVLSPSTARADRQVKRRIYREEGVPEY
jgi:Uma2 family endonuclease